jgi:hypothetical protein
MDRRAIASTSRGLSLVEVVVLLAVITLTALLILVGLSQAREHARLTGCAKNLAQIGRALLIYDQVHSHLPEIGTLGAPGARNDRAAPGPLKTLLETLELPDLTELHDARNPPPRRPGQVPGEVRVPGLLCASDPNALASGFSAPISYRAVTGDRPEGDNGGFAIGGTRSLAAIEKADGSAYTAAFSERLLGDAKPGHPALENYQVVPGVVTGGGCPTSPGPAAWRGDAGSTWTTCDYQSTLYNHSLPPNGRPACVAADGQTAYMGASSGHIRGVNLLLLDGSVTLVRPTIYPKIWREYARIEAPERVGSDPNMPPSR